MRRRWTRLVLAGGLALACVPRGVFAMQRFGPVQFSGNVQSQQLIRTPEAGTFQFIQQRNTVRLRLDYDWLQAGKFYGKYEIPFIESSKLYVLYRGVYDSIYDSTPGFIQKFDVHGRAYGGLSLYDFAVKKGRAAQQLDLQDAELAEARGDTAQAARLRRQARQLDDFARDTLQISGLSKNERDTLRFENQLREVYMDIAFRGIPLNVRAGRQQIVWGESDNFRMLDRANTLNTTWHFVQELPPPAFGWDDIRRPFWMLKFLYDLGDVWKFSQNFLEWYWNPGDWWPVKVTFMPRPWGVPILDPLDNPIDGAFIGGLCERSKFKIRSGVNRGRGYCTTLLNNTKLFNRGDYDRNALENSQVGARYHAIAPNGIEFTLNYFYQRWGGDDGSPSAPIRGLPNTRENRALGSDLLAQGIFPAEYYAPYVHTVGGSANYSDEAYTGAVFRMETVYDVGIPFFDVAKETTIDQPPLPGITKKNMWKGMLGFDRPTWIRAINKKSTVFLSGQFFWHHVIDNPGCDGETVAALGTKAKKRIGSCLVGNLDAASTVRNGSPGNPAWRDKLRDWESLFSIGAFTFYRGGSLTPFVGLAVDPVNHWVMEPFWMVDFYLTPDLAVNLTQRYFVQPTGNSEPIFDPWGFASLSRGRSETSVRLTYNF